MDIRVFYVFIVILVVIAAIGFSFYMTVLIVKALRKYIKSEPVRKEKAEKSKSLGEVLK